VTRTGALETQASLDQAMERIEETAWRDCARRNIEAWRIHGIEFTSDDLRNTVGDPPGSGCSLGALLAAEVRSGRLVVVGRRKSTRPGRHRARINVYAAAQR